MRIDLAPIADSAALLLDAVGRRDAGAARSIAGTLLEFLPPDDFADPAPGLTICSSVQEYEFKAVLPYLRGAVRKWRRWLDVPPRGPRRWLRLAALRFRRWPEPASLRRCTAAIAEIAGQLGVATVGSTSSEAI